MVRKHAEKIALLVSVIVIVLIAGFPLFCEGIGGDVWDLNYHLLRISSMKDALTEGVFPPRVNPLFFDGYGYGSSMFYPDIFLVIPALFHMAGASLLLSYKIFLVMVMVAGTLVTYYCMKFFVQKWQMALLGTYVLMLSTYYLADINNRAGIGEYIAIMLVPVLLVGVYDYLALEGKRVSYIGVALGGMLLCHTIMGFLGCLITVGIFVLCLILPTTRKTVFEKIRFRKLLVTALCTLGVVAYYIFPMLEQMVGDRFWYQTPWANAGDYTQPFKSLFAPVGVFLNIATFGVGVPVLLLVATRVVLGKVKNKWAEGAFLLGIALFLATTKLVPWRILDNTPLKMIQFTYRFYPYAFVLLVFGSMGIYAEKLWDERRRWTKGLPVVVLLLTLVCGVWQNNVCYHFGARYPMDDAYVLGNNHYVGKGEWIPEGVSDQIFQGEAEVKALAGSGEEVEWSVDGYQQYSFHTIEGETCYAVPLLYYKGYEATLQGEGGETMLEIVKGADGCLQVQMDENTKDEPGTVEIRYSGTLIQAVSNWISLLTLLAILALSIRNKKLTKNA